MTVILGRQKKETAVSIRARRARPGACPAASTGTHGRRLRALGPPPAARPRRGCHYRRQGPGRCAITGPRTAEERRRCLNSYGRAGLGGPSLLPSALSAKSTPPRKEPLPSCTLCRCSAQPSCIIGRPRATGWVRTCILTRAQSGIHYRVLVLVPPRVTYYVATGREKTRLQTLRRRTGSASRGRRRCSPCPLTRCSPPP